MYEKYLLGIDNGGTVIKAALFDLAGHQIACESVKTPVQSVRDGFCERSLASIREANFSLIRKLTDQYGNGIISVGITGHGKGLYLLGKNREEYYPGIASTDRRALEYEIRWNGDGTADRVYEKTAQKVMACQPVALLRWMKDHDREAYDRIGCILSVKDFVRYCLTDTVNAEYTDVSGTNLLNLRTRKYDAEILEQFGIEEMYPCLPPVRSSHEVCGYVTEAASCATGLKAGTPVVGGMFDIDACALSVGCTKPGNMCLIAGTWSINEYITKDITDNHTVSMNSVFCDPDLYLAEESSACSAGNLEWFRPFWKNSGYAELDAAVSSVGAEESNIYYMPFLYASNLNPEARASFIGMSANHTQAHVVRAIYEGVVFSHMTHTDKLFASLDKPTEARLAGGVVNSAVWSQMFADAIGIPIEVMENTEMGAKGAAMAAGIGAGVYSDWSDAAQKCVGKGKILKPDPIMTEIYRKKFENYKEIAEALDGIWCKGYFTAKA